MEEAEGKQGFCSQGGFKQPILPMKTILYSSFLSSTLRTMETYSVLITLAY